VILREQAKDIDLVLTDIVMPTFNGMSLYNKIQETNPDLPLVFMTGYPLDAETRSQLEEQSVTLLQKPLTLETIARTLRKALDRQ